VVNREPRQVSRLGGPGPEGRGERGPLILIALGSVSIGVLFGVVNMVLMPILSGLYGDMNVPGALVSAGMVLAAAAGPVLGRWIDRTGRGLAPIGALVGASCVGIVLLMGGSVAAVSAGAVLVSLCAYSLSTPYSAFLTEHSAAESRTRDFGFVMGVANGSGFLVSLAIGALSGRGMKTTLAVVAAMTLLPFLPLLSLVRSRGEPAASSGVAPAFRSPRLVLFLAMQFCFWFSLGGLFPFFTSFLATETPISLSDASLWFGALILLSSLVSALAGRLVGSFHPRKPLFLCVAVVAAVSIAAWAFYGDVVRGRAASVFAIASFLLAGAALGLYYALSSSVLSLLAPPRAQGRAFGMNGIATIVSQALSVWAFGALISRWGYRSMLLGCAAGFLSAAVLAAVLGRSREDAPSPP
jgi:MFS family permease